MPRFVLLYHECPPGYERPSHWDFMLEAGETLRTWSLAQLPSRWQAAQVKTRASHPACPALAARQSVEALLLGNHRRAYLDFEGPLSGERGSVTQIDAGEFTRFAEAPAEWQIELNGGLQGKVALIQAGPNPTGWTLTCDVDR